jgi:hypothetical protein
MQMNIFADIHKGSQMFRASEDLKTYGDIEHYRNAASHQMSFRKCIIDISDLFLNIANGVNCDSTHVVVTPQQPIRPNVHIPNTSAIRRKTEDVCLPRKETGRSPKKNKLKRLLKPSSADERAASKRFKACIGRLVLHRVRELVLRQQVSARRCRLLPGRQHLLWNQWCQLSHYGENDMFDVLSPSVSDL